MAAGTEQKTNDGMKIIGLKRDLGHPFSVCVPCICVCVCVVCVHVCVCVCACVWSLILQAMSLARGLCPGLTPRLALTSITSNEPLHIHTHTCTTHLNTHKRLIKYILFSSFSREPLMETHQDNKCVSVCVFVSAHHSFFRQYSFHSSSWIKTFTLAIIAATVQGSIEFRPNNTVL